MLGLALDRKQIAEAPGAEPLTAGKSIWPEHAFDFAALDGVEGKLNVEFGSLMLTEGMSIPNAHAEVALAPGKLTVSKLARQGAGRATHRQPGTRAGAGWRQSHRRHADLRHADQTAGRRSRCHRAPPAPDAQASLSLAFSGRASTPGALVTVATGKGELKLGDISMHAPTALAVIATSDAVLSGDAGGSGEQLTTALRTQMDASAVAVGPRTIPIEIADGAAKLALVTLDSDAGATKVETTIDLDLAGRRQRLARRTEGAGRSAGRQAARRRAACRRRRLYRPAGQRLGA